MNTSNLDKSMPMHLSIFVVYPDSKVDGANMGPIWDRQDPGGPHVDPMNFGTWVDESFYSFCRLLLHLHYIKILGELCWDIFIWGIIDIIFLVTHVWIHRGISVWNVEMRNSILHLRSPKWQRYNILWPHNYYDDSNYMRRSAHPDYHPWEEYDFMIPIL